MHLIKTHFKVNPFFILQQGNFYKKDTHSIKETFPKFCKTKTAKIKMGTAYILNQIYKLEKVATKK